MTSDAEHTPSPQSVVVPVERLQFAIDAIAHLKPHKARTVLEQALETAPAPSSLAGGEEAYATEPEPYGEVEGMCWKASIESGDYLIAEIYGDDRAQTKDRTSKFLAALSPEAPARDGEDDAELSVLDREAIDRSFRTVQAYDAVRDLQAALLDTMKRQHTGYDWNADPDQMTLKQGNALALATKVFSDLNAAVDAHDDFTDADWEAALTPRHEAPAEPVSDHYKFDDEIAWLREAARYFSVRDTKGEDGVHWANVYNAENAVKLADRLAELSSNPCQLEAPAERAGEFEDLKAANKDHCRAVNTLTLEAIEFERQIADLRASVVKANSGFEEYERKFYLAADDVDRLKLAICGGEDAPGAISAVSVDDCERFITEERGRHIDTEARLEYVRASRDGAAGRAHDLYMALAEVKEQVVTYPLSDNSTCMCGAPLGGHNVGSGHAPVSLADHAISLIVEGIDKALRFGAPTDGRPDDYEGPDAGMHDTEIVERDND